MRQLILMFWVLSASIASAQSKGTLTPDQVYANNKSSVVTIVTFDANEKATSQGSGFIIEKDRIATNHHVVEGSSTAIVVFSDGSVQKTDAVAADSASKDIAILKVPTGTRSRVTFGNELKLQVGETIYVIGAPKGLSASFSSGIVSAFRQDEGQFLIQMTASIASGSSGGPVFDRQGQVIGIATSKLTEGNFGFAVGAGDIQQLLKVPPTIAMRLSDLETRTPASPTPLAPEESEGAIAKAQELYNAKKYADALSSFQTLPAAAKDSYQGQLLLCQIQSELSQYNEAVKACDSAIRLQPSDATPHGLKAFTMFVGGDLAQAEAAAKDATSLSDAQYYKTLLATIYYWREKYDLVRNLISTDSNDTYELTMLAGADVHLADWSAFKQVYSKLSTVKAENGWKYYLDALNDYRNLDFESADKKFQKCDQDKDFVDPMCAQNHIRIQTIHGNWEASYADLAMLLKRYPENSSLLEYAVFLSLLRSDKVSANNYFLRYQRTPSGKADEGTSCLYYYGMDQAYLATEHCSAGINANEKNYVAWANAGWVALDNSKYVAASELFAKAITLFYADKAKHTVTQEVDVMWGGLLAHYYAGDKKVAKEAFKYIKKAYPDFVTLANLKQLPLVWSQRTQELISGVTRDFR